MYKIMTVILLSATVLSACGGGGGGGGGGQQPSGAVIHILTTAGTTTLYGSSGIGGVGLAITFPPGVAVKTDATGTVDSSVAVPSGVLNAGSAWVLPPVYTAATTTVRGRLDLIVSSVTLTGFGTGEFLTINFVITSGSPTAGSFQITDFAPQDLFAQPITGMVPGATISIQ